MLYPESKSQSDTKKKAILKQADIHSDVSLFKILCSVLQLCWNKLQLFSIHFFFISRSVSLIKLNLSQIKRLEPFFLFYF